METPTIRKHSYLFHTLSIFTDFSFWLQFMTAAGNCVFLCELSPPSSALAAAVFPLLQSQFMACKDRISSLGQRKKEIQTKISI